MLRCASAATPFAKEGHKGLILPMSKVGGGGELGTNSERQHGAPYTKYIHDDTHVGVNHATLPSRMIYHAQSTSTMKHMLESTMLLLNCQRPTPRAQQRFPHGRTADSKRHI